MAATAYDAVASGLTASVYAPTIGHPSMGSNPNPYGAETRSAEPGQLAGAVALSGTAVDAGSGVASMRFEYKLSSGSTWATACTDSSPPSPFLCSWSSGAVADGIYDFRSVAVDAAGNERTSATVANHRVDNLARRSR